MTIPGRPSPAVQHQRGIGWTIKIAEEKKERLRREKDARRRELLRSQEEAERIELVNKRHEAERIKLLKKQQKEAERLGVEFFPPNLVSNYEPAPQGYLPPVSSQQKHSLLLGLFSFIFAIPLAIFRGIFKLVSFTTKTVIKLAVIIFIGYIFILIFLHWVIPVLEPFF